MFIKCLYTGLACTGACGYYTVLACAGACGVYTSLACTGAGGAWVPIPIQGRLELNQRKSQLEGEHTWWQSCNAI